MSFHDHGESVADAGAGDLMMATLAAFPVLGFFAATLLSLARFILLILCASTAVTFVGLAQGMPLLSGLGLGIGDIALSQVGYGLGLVWVASTRSHVIKD